MLLYSYNYLIPVKLSYWDTLILQATDVKDWNDLIDYIDLVIYYKLKIAIVLL